MSSITAQKSKRPLSPHLQIYKLPLTAFLSISHRFTGVILSTGSILVAAFFFAAAISPEAYEFLLNHAEAWYGKIILFGWSAALYYHMSNGVRHMIWDTGKFLSKKSAMTSNYFVLFFTALLTLGTWLMACPCLKG